MKRRKAAKIRKIPIEKKAEMAMREAVADLIRERRKTGQPLFIWKNNRVVTVSPRRTRLPPIR